jgi:hypothetical protein
MGNVNRLTTLTIFATVFLVSTGGPVWAQGEGAIHGKVIAAADGSALPDPHVTLRFAFSGVRAEEYALSASYDGFRPGDVRLVLEPREVRALTVSLNIAGPVVSVEVTAAVTFPSTHSPSSTTLTSNRLAVIPVFQP